MSRATQAILFGGFVAVTLVVCAEIALLCTEPDVAAAPSERHEVEALCRRQEQVFRPYTEADVYADCLRQRGLEE